jgi:CheY-like chemotaxis protein
MYSINKHSLECHLGRIPVSIASDHVFFPSDYHRFSSNNVDLHNSMKTIKIDSSLGAITNQTQRILLVDDDADISNLFKLSLERDGFVVDTFNDPLLALFNYKAGAYNLLLLDIKMPHMNGFELFQKIKQLDDKVKVCFVTAFEEPHIEFRRLFPNMEEGDFFIRKPIELRALDQKVKSQLAV